MRWGVVGREGEKRTVGGMRQSEDKGEAVGGMGEERGEDREAGVGWGGTVPVFLGVIRVIFKGLEVAGALVEKVVE